MSYCSSATQERIHKRPLLPLQRSSCTMASEGNSIPDVQTLDQVILDGKSVGPIPRVLLQADDDIQVERACTDEFSGSTGQRFCRLYKVSSIQKGLMLPKEQPRKDSPSKPFFNDPTLGVEVILESVFRAKGKQNLKAKVFTCWFACPANESQEALCFTAGHCFTKEKLPFEFAERGCLDFGEDNFSEVVGCLGTNVGNAEFGCYGFSCASKPVAIINDDAEDLALMQVKLEKMNQFLLPCSAQLECVEKKYIAVFSYPCTQSFIMQAYSELIEGRQDHGIKELYSLLGLENGELYKSLAETFQDFNDGSLICSPGAIREINEKNFYYKCSTVGGSSGGPIILTHEPGYTIGTHDGAMRSQDYNMATSTDSPTYVNMYAHFVLPRLPGEHTIFWKGKNLRPFHRWLTKHGLVW